jgi:prevent-host-death family protein
MRERRIGIRELKSRLSECVRDVKDGQAIVVTERGRAVARLIPDRSRRGPSGLRPSR